MASFAAQAYNINFSYNNNVRECQRIWNTIIVTRFESKKRKKKKRKRRNTYASRVEHARVATLSNSPTITGFIDDK